MTLQGGATVDLVCNKKCRKKRDKARRHNRKHGYHKRSKHKHHKHGHHGGGWGFGRPSYGRDLGSHEHFGKGYTYYGDPGQMFTGK
ncbi:MAG: hypothetical protein AAFN05_12625 [Pseudomonadota bacterium]